MRRWMIGVVAAGTFAACGDDDKKPADTADTIEAQGEVETTEPDTTDTAEPDTAGPATPDGPGDTGDTTVVYPKPDNTPDNRRPHEGRTLARRTTAGRQPLGHSVGFCLRLFRCCMSGTPMGVGCRRPSATERSRLSPAA